MPRRLLKRALAKTVTKAKQVAVFAAYVWDKFHREVRGVGRSTFSDRR